MTRHSFALGQKGGLPCALGVLAVALMINSSEFVNAVRKNSDYKTHVILVQFEPGIAVGNGAAKAGSEGFDRRASRFGVHAIERAFPFLDHVQPTPKTAYNLAALRRTYYVRYRADDDPEDVATEIARVPNVISAEPVLSYRLYGQDRQAVPNDTLFRMQSYLRHMRIPSAWSKVKGENGNDPVVIAIVDGGANWRHVDLRTNTWTNEDEIAYNGIDDDDNGFIDDRHGVNFVNGDNRDNDPTGERYTSQANVHGTAVAGAASAVTNNIRGIAGAAWNAELMHINAGCEDDRRGICFGYEGILYAAANGADIINASWGGYRGTLRGGQVQRIIAQALDLATDMGSLVVTAAGNDGMSNDVLLSHPAAHPRVLSVGATAKDSRSRAAFSNYGKTVNVYAPGEGILTTGPYWYDFKYSVNGTSFAASLVSGMAALVRAQFPDISADELRERIRLASESMDTENPGYGGMLGRGYVNAEAALQEPTLPAVRVKRWSWSDSDGDTAIASGDEVMIEAAMVNYLADAEDLAIEIAAAESYPFIDITATGTTVGRLARGDSTRVTFRFSVADQAPLNRGLRFYVRVSDGEFMDEADQFSVIVNSRQDLVHSALSALYLNTDGNNWRRNSGWETGMVPTADQLAQWYGITLQESRLVELNLAYNGLTGRLPSELGYLSNLLWLYLQGNSVSGKVPRELGLLSQLQRLDLSHNSLSGELPMELGRLSHLRRLYLGGNALSGAIPKEFGDLSRLQRLYLGYNSLSGEIPKELGQLSQLEWLILDANSLSGVIPKELGYLSELQWLGLKHNSLSGPLPSELGNLSRLRLLYLRNNALIGEIPRELGNLSRLESLFLNNNALSGVIPRELGDLSELRSLFLNSNSLSGTIPTELGKLSQLESLNLANNQLLGKIPEELSNLTQLQWLWIAGNSLSGPISKEFRKLLQLERMSLNDNYLTGSISPELSEMTRLKVLHLHNNSLSGPIPRELGDFPTLEELDLHANYLSGTIPPELGNIFTLKKLSLNENFLSGDIPQEIGNLSKLELLDLSENMLTGLLPRSLLQLTNLKTLHFGGQDLCAPQDESFHEWLKSIPDASGPICSATYLTSAVEDQTFILDRSITALVLPEAEGGTEPYSYTLNPSLPAGLSFTDSTRTVSGTPIALADKAAFTYTATDATGGADSLTFDIEVVPPPLAASRGGVPEKFTIHGNYPNPFNHSTHLLFDLPWPARVTVDVLDLAGRHILTVPAANLEAGWEHSIELRGAKMASGIYLYRVIASSPVGSATHVGRLVRVR